MDYHEELKNWLTKEVERRAMLDAENLSVSVCRSCQKRGIWGGCMTGVRATTCSGCKLETAHDFYPFNLGQNS